MGKQPYYDLTYIILREHTEEKSYSLWSVWENLHLQFSLRSSENSHREKPYECNGVGNLSLEKSVISYIREYTQGKNLISVMNVEAPFYHKSDLAKHIREHTQGKNPMNVVIIRKPSVATQVSKYIRESM